MKKNIEEQNKGKEILEILQEKYELNSAQDLSYALKDLFKDALQQMMNAEFDTAMGYSKYDKKAWSKLHFSQPLSYFEYPIAVSNSAFIICCNASLNKSFKAYDKSCAEFNSYFSCNISNISLPLFCSSIFFFIIKSLHFYYCIMERFIYTDLFTDSISSTFYFL